MVRDGRGAELGSASCRSSMPPGRPSAARAGTAPRRSICRSRGGWALFLAYELAAEIEPRDCTRRRRGRCAAARPWRCAARGRGGRSRRRAPGAGRRGRARRLLDALAADLASGGPRHRPAPCLAATLEEDGRSAPRRRGAGARPPGRWRCVPGEPIARGGALRLPHCPMAPAALHTPACVPPIRRRLPACGRTGLGRGQFLAERLVEVRGRRVRTPQSPARVRLAGDDEAARVRELISHPRERAGTSCCWTWAQRPRPRVRAGSVSRWTNSLTVEATPRAPHRVQRRRPPAPGCDARRDRRGLSWRHHHQLPKLRCVQIIAALGAPAAALHRRHGLPQPATATWTSISSFPVTHHPGGRAAARAGPASWSIPMRRATGETRHKARGLLRASLWACRPETMADARASLGTSTRPMLVDGVPARTGRATTAACWRRWSVRDRCCSWTARRRCGRATCRRLTLGCAAAPACRRRMYGAGARRAGRYRSRAPSCAIRSRAAAEPDYATTIATRSRVASSPAHAAPAPRLDWLRAGSPGGLLRRATRVAAAAGRPQAPQSSGAGAGPRGVGRSRHRRRSHVRFADHPVCATA